MSFNAEFVKQSLEWLQGESTSPLNEQKQQTETCSDLPESTTVSNETKVVAISDSGSDDTAEKQVLGRRNPMRGARNRVHYKYLNGADNKENLINNSNETDVIEANDETVNKVAFNESTNTRKIAENKKRKQSTSRGRKNSKRSKTVQQKIALKDLQPSIDCGLDWIKRFKNNVSEHNKIMRYRRPKSQTLETAGTQNGGSSLYRANQILRSHVQLLNYFRESENNQLVNQVADN